VHALKRGYFSYGRLQLQVTGWCCLVEHTGGCS
jgi:hypothetical protein